MRKKILLIVLLSTLSSFIFAADGILMTEEVAQPMEKTDTLSISVDYNWLNTLFMQAFKYNLVLRTQKTSWVIPLYQRNSDSNEILGQYDKMNSIGIKVRKYFKNRRGWYLDLGMQYMKLHHQKWYPEDSERWLSCFNALISFGNIKYITKDIYIRNQLNAAIPFAGNDIYYNGYSMNSDWFMMDFEFMVLGINFGNFTK